jgi:hypothetical protein
MLDAGNHVFEQGGSGVGWPRFSGAWIGFGDPETAWGTSCWFFGAAVGR